MKENYKKVFLKIFGITLLVQIIGIAAMNICDAALASNEKSTTFPIFFLLAGIFVSFVLNIILSLRWYQTKKAKLLSIFLMPTNYTFPLIVLFVCMFVFQTVDILDGLGAYFG